MGDQTYDDGSAILRTGLDGAKLGMSAFEALGVGGLGAFGAMTGPLGAAFAIPTLAEGFEQRDPLKIARGSVGVGSGAYSLTKGITAIADGALGGGELAAAGASESLLGSLLGPLGLVSAAATFGWDVGRLGDNATKDHIDEHHWWGDMTEDQHRFAEGKKVDTGGMLGHAAGGIQAGVTGIEDGGLWASNAAGIAMPAGIVDALTERTNQARDRHAVAQVAASVPVHEDEPSMGRMTQTSHEMSTADQVATWRLERELRRTTQDTIDMANGEIQMPAMDMRRPPTKPGKR